jgi:effector-binding domain-containing protein
VSQTLAQVFPEVMRAMAEQGVQPAGPPFSRYHRIDAAKNEIDLEAGLPVRTPFTSAGRVKADELPGGRVARTWHVGPYHELARSYARLEAWMKSEGLRARGAFWEVYMTDPGIETDPKKWKTQILWPIE